MSTNTARYAGYFSPSELTVLETLVKDVCLEIADCAPERSNGLAGEAIKMYQNGTRDFDVIRNRLRLLSRFRMVS